MATAETSEKLPGVPKTWPGGFGTYKYSKAAVMVNLAVFFGFMAINWASSSVINALTGGHHATTIALSVLLSLLLTAFFMVANAKVLLAGIDRKTVKFEEVFKESGEQIWEMLLLLVLQAFIVTASLLLFVIPFFFVVPRLALASYYLVDKKISAVDALKASWNQSKGHSAKVWGIVGVFFSLVLLMITIIGIPFAIYFFFMYSAAMPVLYRFVSSSPKQAQVVSS